MSTTRGRCVALMALAWWCSGELASPGQLFPSDENQVRVQERGGTVYVDNPQAAVWPRQSGMPAKLVEEQAFGADMSPRDAILGAITGVAVDNEGNVFVVDRQAGRLVSFQADGSVRWAAGRTGQGPGELSRPGGLVLGDSATLYLLNAGGTQIDIWSTNGEYQDTHRLVDLGIPRAALAGFEPPDLLVLHRATTEVLGKELFVVDVRSWSLVSRFTGTVAPSLSGPVYNRAVSFRAAVAGPFVWLGNSGEYVLRAYTLQGRLTRVISVDAEYLRRTAFQSDDRELTGFMNLGELRPPVMLPGGHLLVSASWPTNVDEPDEFLRRRRAEGLEVEWACSLDLFDKDGRFLGSTVWSGTMEPEFGLPVVFHFSLSSAVVVGTTIKKRRLCRCRPGRPFHFTNADFPRAEWTVPMRPSAAGRLTRSFL